MSTIIILAVIIVSSAIWFFISDKNYQKEIQIKNKIQEINENEEKKHNRNHKSDQRFCGFCVGSPMSKEHLSPNWIKDIIPRSKSTSYTSDEHNMTFPAPKVAVMTTDRVTKQGNIGTVKYRVVCQKCNNGWMSQLEDKARPILTPLILNQKYIFTKEDLEIVTQWAVLRSIIQDLARPDSQVITPYERQLFHKNRSISKGWVVWIGRYTGTDHFLRHLHGSVYLGPSLIEGQKHNTLHSFFIIGHLLVFTERVEEEKVKVNLPKSLIEKLIKVYPKNVSSLDWLSLPSIDDTDKNIINNLMSPMKKLYKFKVCIVYPILCTTIWLNEMIS